MTSVFAKHRIKFTVILTLALIGVTPFVPSLSQLLPWSVIVLCVVTALMAMLAKDRFDAGLAGVLAAVFAGARLIFPNPDGSTITLRTAALSAYVLLHVILLIGPWSRFSSRIRGWYKHRRHLGVTAFFLGLLHAAIVLNLYYGGDILLAWQSVFTFFGSTALTVMAVLAITSWDWWQKHVPWKLWALAHAAVLAVYLIELYIVIGIWRSIGDVPTWTIPVFAAFILFWIVIAPWGLAPRLFKVLNGWKQLHVLIYIAYISVVLHLYFGAAQAQGPWARFAVLALFALVAGSHAYGWIVNWKEKKRLAVAESSSEPWHDVAALSDLKEGEGKRIDVHGLPVALFLHQGRVLAYFGFCSHQKGPLWQGKIVNGYLECPWHGWQYSVTDGSGPPGFHDRVPFYETKIENGRVWVKIEKGRACNGYSCTACSCRA